VAGGAATLCSETLPPEAGATVSETLTGTSEDSDALHGTAGTSNFTGAAAGVLTLSDELTLLSPPAANGSTPVDLSAVTSPPPATDTVTGSGFFVAAIFLASHIFPPAVFEGVSFSVAGLSRSSAAADDGGLVAVQSSVGGSEADELAGEADWFVVDGDTDWLSVEEETTEGLRDS